MKKILIIIVSILVLIVGIIICVPYFFKSQIINITKKEINNTVNGTVNFNDVSLSMLKSFPNLEVEVSDLCIIGDAPFKGDTLVYVQNFAGTINIWKAIKGEYVITQLNIDNAKVNIITDSKGKVNYDIAKNDSSTASSTNYNTDNISTTFHIELKSFKINNTNISYIDSVGSMVAEMKDLNLNLNGNFSSNLSQLSLTSSIGALRYQMDGVNYLNDAQIIFNTKINADFKNNKYTLLDNTLFINRFELSLEGWLQPLDQKTTMDLQFSAKKTSFDALLELIPAAYKSYIKGVDTKGDFIFRGYAKGDYTNTTYPEFGLTANIKDGYVKYPDLPQAINNIDVDLKISHPNATDLDAMIIAINNCSFNTVGNQFKSSWIFKTPISDLSINGSMDGDVDLKKLGQALPLGNLKIDGAIKAKIEINGHMSQIEKQQYNKFKASGFLSLAQFNMQTPDLTTPVSISSANMTFTPQAVNLEKMDMMIGKSDFHLTGKITDYIPYLFKGGTIKALFNYNSKLLNATELMSNSSTSKSGSTSKSNENDTSINLIQIPNNIDFRLNTQIDHLMYEDLDISNTQGVITIQNSEAKLSNLNTHLLDGILTLNGVYNAQNPKSHKTQMNLIASKFNISKVASSLPTVTKFAPIIKHMQGDVSAKMDISNQFDEKQNIMMNSINSKGNISTSALTVTKLDILDKLSKKIGTPSLSSLNAKPFQVNYAIENGEVKIDTFTSVVNNYRISVWGTSSLDQQINYFMKVPVPAKSLGTQATSLLSVLESNPEQEIPVTVNFKGAMKSPTVSLDLSEAQKMITNQVKTKTQDKVKDVLGGFLNKLK